MVGDCNDNDSWLWGFYPKTIVGKFAAAILMFLGIGLIGYLTSTITNYFTNDMEQKEKAKSSNKFQKIESLERKIDLLVNKIETLEGNNRKNK